MTLSDKLYKILIEGGSWKTILGGLWVTVKISLFSLIIGTVLGAFICLHFLTSSTAYSPYRTDAKGKRRKQFNPFSQDDDGLGVTILKQMAKQIDYDWKDGRSLIKVAL